MSETRNKDLELWRTWKASRSPAATDALLRQLAPILKGQVDRWARVAPRYLLENEAKLLAIKAFESYDPSRAALATHVTNALAKLSREAYERQSTLSVPEAKRLMFNNVHKQSQTLEDHLGRPPSLDELADHMRLPQARVQSLLQEVGKRELMESGEGPSFVQHADDPEVVHLAFHDMTPLQQHIFSLRTGYNGAKITNGTGIMRATGLSQGQLSLQLTKITATLQRAQALR